MSCLISPNGIWSLQSRPLVPVGRSLVSCCIGTAHGEVVVIDDKFGLKVTEIVNSV